MNINAAGRGRGKPSGQYAHAECGIAPRHEGLIEQLTQLRAPVQSLQASQVASEARHEANVSLLGRGILTLLVQSGFTKAQARAAIATPFGRPTPAAESPERPTAAGEPLASALPSAAPGTDPHASKLPRPELVSVQTELADADPYSVSVDAIEQVSPGGKVRKSVPALTPACFARSVVDGARAPLTG